MCLIVRFKSASPWQRRNSPPQRLQFCKGGAPSRNADLVAHGQAPDTSKLSIYNCDTCDIRNDACVFD